ncbi:mechanosensitive ion channel family protein [Helicobacter sp. MIT 14-3879]|uniref:mechanosensitive ion channel family protein n=1 Tax=Helicobacter sp. MIT 14-3879 TaxID=2040649 RepID=UPI0015F16D5D|nr:mechanosensitive ion channel family protein [Helicobacter sp. MIT 14-3879]
MNNTESTLQSSVALIIIKSIKKLSKFALLLTLSIMFLQANEHKRESSSADSNQNDLSGTTKSKVQPITQDKSIDSLVDSIVELNWHIRFIDIAHKEDKTVSQQTNPLRFLTKEELVEKKEILLESFPLHIVNNKKPIVFNFELNSIDHKKQEAQFNESTILHNDFLALQNNISLQMLKAQKIFFTTLVSLRKRLDFFSQQTTVLGILNPSITQLKQLPNHFEIPSSLLKKEKEILDGEEEKYLNMLASYIEILSYLELKSSELLPQNTLLNLTMQWFLEEIANFIPVDHSNLIIAKVFISLLIFLILWAFRKLVAKVIMFVMDFIVHISRQDKDLHAEIQKGILKPISWLLFAWSVSVSIGILYYPTLEPESIANWFVIFYILNIAWLFIAIIKSYGAALISTIAQKSDGGFRKEVINLILNVLYSVVCIVAVLIILKKLGFNVSAIIASLGLGGLAVALAVKDMLANFFASVMLLLDNSFSQGDWIVAGNVEGTVVEIGLRRTTIRTFDNALLFVPNSELAGKSIINWNRRKEGRRIKMAVGVTYDATPEKLRICVEKITQMLINHEEIAAYPNKQVMLDEADHKLSARKDIISISDYLGYKSGVYVSIDELADSSINITLDCFTRSVAKADFLRVREEIILKIMDIVAECELNFAFPSQSVYVENLSSLKM